MLFTHYMYSLSFNSITYNLILFGGLCLAVGQRRINKTKKKSNENITQGNIGKDEINVNPPVVINK